jgi:hypothetical protein
MVTARRIAKSIIGSVLSLVLITLLGIHFSLFFINQDFLTDAFEKIISSQMQQADIENYVKYLDLVCAQTDEIEIQGFNISLKCEEIKGKSIDEIVEITATKLAEKIFYTQPDCKPVECLKEKKFEALVTHDFQMFLIGFQHTLIFVFIILLALYMAICSTWSERFKSIGYLFLFSALPLLVGNILFPSFISYLPQAQMLQDVILAKISEFNNILFALLACSLVFIGISLFVDRKKEKD